MSSPSAMKELRNATPSIVPRTLTSPRVPKYSADPGIIRYVQPPLAGLRCSVAVNCLSIEPSDVSSVPGGSYGCQTAYQHQTHRR